jgi:hypothetical protein
LLEYTQELVKKGGNSSTSAHKLQAILQSSPVKNNEQQPNNSKLPWIIGGTAVISLALIIGYLLGKRRKEVLEY